MGNKPIYFRMGLETTWLGLEPRQTHATWFQDLMKLRFLMSHRRKNSVRDRVKCKKWIYLERNILHRMWAISKSKRTPGYGVVSFYRGG